MGESIKKKYHVKVINPKHTHVWILQKHYAKRLPSISLSYGLFQNSNNLLVGILTIGKPASPQLCIGICGHEYSKYVYELNRLCIDEGLEKNVLSYFVGRVLKLIQKDMILVSYADTEYGHHGYIYQATNWLYTGLSEKRRDKKTIGSDKHIRHNNAYENKYKDFEFVERSRKHRYVKFIGGKKRGFRKALNYEILPYPKGKNTRYKMEDKQMKLF